METGKNTKIWHEEKSIFCECTIGENCKIHAPVWIGEDVKIGDNCKIQAFVFIPTGVTIGNNVFVGPHVCFTNDKYPPSGNWTETIIKDNVSIGAGAVILPGIVIEKGAVIGAGSVVTKNVPAGAVVVGNPAREIKKSPDNGEQKPKRFAVIGLGFIFNKHAEAIKENGGEIVIGCDIDETKQKKLPQGADFTSDWRTIKDVDFVSILTPNYLHKDMAEFFAKKKITVLVEKPPVIDSHDLKKLSKYKNIFTVLQLRHHPELLKWKKEMNDWETYNVEMKINVRRDDWYFESWKAKELQSGGLLFNIGVHYFDALTFLFGPLEKAKTIDLNTKRATGLIDFENARVQWELSLDAPMDNQQRIFEIDGEKLNLGQGFDNLHIKVYEKLLNGEGVPIQSCKKTIELIEKIKKNI